MAASFPYPTNSHGGDKALAEVKENRGGREGDEIDNKRGTMTWTRQGGREY